MSVLDNHQDPFEANFSERFSEFESEPSSFAWSKIQKGFAFTPPDTIEETYKRHFTEYEAQPSPTLWDKIQTGIRPPRAIYWQYGRWAAVIGGLALLMGGGVYMFTNNTPPKAAIQTEIKRNPANTNIEQHTNITQTEQSITKHASPQTLKVSSDKSHLQNNKAIAIVAHQHITDNSQVVSGSPDKLSQSISSNNDITALSSHNVIDTQTTNTFVFDYLQGKAFNPLNALIENPIIDYQLPPIEKINSYKGIELYASIMPLYSSAEIHPVLNDAVLVKQIHTSQAISAQRVGLTAQLGVSWKLNTRLRLRTSVSYIQFKQNIDYNYQPSEPIDYSVSRLDNNSISLIPIYDNKTAQNNGTYHFVGINTDVQYILSHSPKVNHYLSAGSSIGMRQYEQEKGHIQGFMTVGMGSSYFVAPKLKVWIEPSLHYSLNQIMDTNGLVNTRPVNAGLHIGMCYLIR
jgi:hypothetical protein